jgi:hypothetical protein
MAKSKFDKFDPTVEKWDNFEERLDNSMKVTNDMKKTSFMLNSVSPADYRLLRRAATGKLSALKYDELLSLARKTFLPKQSKYAAQKAFRDAKRRPEETAQEFLQRLQELAETCEFPEDASMTVYQYELLSQFVIGINQPTIEFTLGTKKASKLTLELAVDLASDQLATLKNINSTPRKEETIYSAQEKSVGGSGSSMQQHQGSYFQRERRACWRCGDDHMTSRCPEKEQRCSECKKIGHVQEMCQVVHKFWAKKNNGLAA